MIASLPQARVALAAAVLMAAHQASALTFNFSYGAGVTPDIVAASVAAGNLWSGYFNDPITLNVTINYTLGGSSVGESTPAFLASPASYASVRTALIGDVLTPDDLSSTGALQAGPSVFLAINRTGGALRIDTGGTSTANNTLVTVERPVAKALGLLAGNDVASDGSINLNPGLSYDGNRGDGIAGGSYDLIGVIAHELGHVLGFQSVAETISVFGGLIGESGATPRVADLFRFSADSINPAGPLGANAGPGVFDVSADNRAKYFSVDGGASIVAELARGSDATFGNQQQANHWLANVVTPIGIMDPTIGPGELLTFTSPDLRFFDVIGYNPVPEPSTWAAGFALVAGTGWLLRRRSARS